jgi:hypothetical protein
VLFINNPRYTSGFSAFEASIKDVAGEFVSNIILEHLRNPILDEIGFLFKAKRAHLKPEARVLILTSKPHSSV